jgi:hypothetical protein
MTVQEIVTIWLKANGYDGLYDGNGCGCHVDDLAPCVTVYYDCVAGHKVPCKSETCEADGDCQFHIGPKRGSHE